MIDNSSFVTELQIVSIGPNASLTGPSQLRTSDALLDIDLLGIAQNNDGTLMPHTISVNWCALSPDLFCQYFFISRVG